MAKIALGMWTSHGPTLSTTPEQWLMRLPADRARKDHPFRGKTHTFDELVELRRAENLSEKSSLAERTRRAGACRSAIDRMAGTFEQVGPDCAVIFGNDQNEIFLDDIVPALTIFDGPVIWNEPASEEQARKMPPGIHEAEWGHNPPVRTEYPGNPALARHFLVTATRGNFDVSRSSRVPENPGHWSSGIGHAYGFVYRQIMRDKAIPNVPVMTNTFFPPNQPTARRCFEFGKLIGNAIRAWPTEERVAIIGSGGMSHFVIDEDFDHMVLQAIDRRDEEALCSIGEEWFQSGTSELKNWIMAAGVLFASELRGGTIAYEPCYRSEAGTGTANGFVCWR